MSFLKRKTVRTAAALIAFILAAASVFTAFGAMAEYYEADSERENVFLLNDNVPYQSSELNSRLWMLVNMYMLNTDEDGNIKGNEFFAKSLEDEMRRAGVTDRSGNPVIPESERFYYSLHTGREDITNGAAEIKKYSDSRYKCVMKFTTDGSSIEQHPDMDYYYYTPFMTSSRSYTNTQGMYYYYNDGHGYAVYDYDTTSLDYYDDDLGARIYLNKDGTTPVPSIYNETGYESFDNEQALDEGDMLIASPEKVTVDLIPYEEYIAECDTYLEHMAAAEQDIVRTGFLAAVLFAAAVILGGYVIVAGGYDETKGSFVLRTRDTVPGEIFVFTGLVVPFVSLLILGDTLGDIGEFIIKYKLNSFAVKSACSTGAGIFFIMVIASLDSLLNRVKCHSVTDTFFITSAVKKVFRSVKERINSLVCLRDDAFTVRFLIRLAEALLGGIAAVVFGIISDQVLVVLAIAVLVLIFYVYESMKDLKALNNLGKHISGISAGDYTPRIEEKTSVTYGMTSSLNNISDGIQTAVEDQIRSERMKIELVTNVSHDLKTPLTSVISYVDLLSKEELTPAAADYVAVLEQKTARLKTIVSDVFDLAKATTSTDVNIERIDAVILMKQVLADMEDRISEYGREIKTEINAENVFIEAEGKKMYRVLQNVIDNALKYSMSGTRIFARLDSENGKMKISVKNTSSYEMTFTPDEIAERFTRGDKARTTEGSGLGLSIAKSFTEACGGRFKISIDGDVFAVSVEFDGIN